MKRSLEVNGRARRFEADGLEPLAVVLREKLKVKSVPARCDGACACLVLLAGEPVRACEVPLVHAERAPITSYEGLVDDPRAQSLLRAMEKLPEPPCATCRSSLVVLAHAFLAAETRLPGESAREALSDVTCECLGFQRFPELVEKLAQKKKRRARRPRAAAKRAPRRKR